MQTVALLFLMEIRNLSIKSHQKHSLMKILAKVMDRHAVVLHIYRQHGHERGVEAMVGMRVKLMEAVNS